MYDVITKRKEFGNMSERNVFKESKETLAEKMLKNLNDTCAGTFDFELDHDEFIRCFKRNLIDYALVPKNGIID